jgi:hypothetical protein
MLDGLDVWPSSTLPPTWVAFRKGLMRCYFQFFGSSLFCLLKLSLCSLIPPFSSHQTITGDHSCTFCSLLGRRILTEISTLQKRCSHPFYSKQYGLLCTRIIAKWVVVPFLSVFWILHSIYKKTTFHLYEKWICRWLLRDESRTSWKLYFHSYYSWSIWSSTNDFTFTQTENFPISEKYGRALTLLLS